MADTEREHEPEPKNFAPKKPVELAEPKDDPITYEELAKCDGKKRTSRSTSTCSCGWPAGAGHMHMREKQTLEAGRLTKHV